MLQKGFESPSFKAAEDKKGGWGKVFSSSPDNKSIFMRNGAQTENKKNGV